MKKNAIVVLVLGFMFVACLGGCEMKNKDGDNFMVYMKKLQQCQDNDRENGIVDLIKSNIPMLGTTEAMLKDDEFGFEYMKNVKEYRKNIMLFSGITGFLDIGAEKNKITTISFYMSEHASEYNQQEMTLLDNVVSNFGDPYSINFNGQPQDDFENIKAAFLEEDEYADISYDCLWKDINETNYSFFLKKEFSMFKNRNLSNYIFR